MLVEKEEREDLAALPTVALSDLPLFYVSVNLVFLCCDYRVLVSCLHGLG